MNAAFGIGITALRVGRRALDLTGQNITNASTPGYSRQSLNLVSKTAGKEGVGVEVSGITRYTAPSLRSAILRSNSDMEDAQVRLRIRQQIETALGTGTGSVGGRIEEFFNNIQALSSRPQDTAARRPIISAAANLADQFNQVAGDIDRLRSDVGREIKVDIATINSTTQRIADLNGRILEIESQGQPANELRDQRQQFINELSKKVDVRSFEQENGVVNVIGSGFALVVGYTAAKFQLGSDSSGNLIVSESGGTSVLFKSGELGGRLREYNEDIPATRARLDDLATQFIQKVNSVQATGVGVNGPVSSMTGTRSIDDPNAPLVTQTIPLGTQPGLVIISVTEVSTGTRTNFTVSVDPTSQSLNDLAGAITVGTSGQVQANVNPTSNTLQLVAPSGYRFDIAGRIPSTSPPQYVDSDTTGLFAALGLNGVFQGTNASNIRIDPALVKDPNLLSASRSGDAGDSRNLERFAALRDSQIFGNRTFTQEYADLNSMVGDQVLTLNDAKTAQANLLQNLNAQEQAITGVDVDEELVQLLNYQKMVQTASQYISVVNTALDSILSIVK